jgi:hypothetical protein
MIRKLASGEYRLYSRKPDPKTGKRRNLGTFSSREQAEKHEREIQYFKRHWTAHLFHAPHLFTEVGAISMTQLGQGMPAK